MKRFEHPPVARRSSYGSGRFRRRIRLWAQSGEVKGELEDDFHHFDVRLRHDGKRVLAVQGNAERFPWSTCPGAVDPLEELRGLELSVSLRDVARYTDPRSQCTHLFDLAALTITLAASGQPERCYDIDVPDRIAGVTCATLHRDGALQLRWQVDGIRVLEPAPFTGRSLAGGGFADWAEAELEPELAEAAQLLRRASVIAMGRFYDMDQVESAAAFHAAAAGACFTFDPARVSSARRAIGSTRDFSPSPDPLLRASQNIPKADR